MKIEPWLGGPLKTEPFSNIVEAVLRALALPKSSATVDLDTSDLQQVTVNANSSPGFPLRYQGFTKLRAAYDDGALANQVKSLLEVISNSELADSPQAGEAPFPQVETFTPKVFSPQPNLGAQ